MSGNADTKLWLVELPHLYYDPKYFTKHHMYFQFQRISTLLNCFN